MFDEFVIYIYIVPDPLSRTKFSVSYFVTEISWEEFDEFYMYLIKSWTKKLNS